MVALRIPSPNSNVIEKAETHRPISFGVMSRGSHCTERTRYFSTDHGINGYFHGTCG
jgi:hypothetical protein